MKNSLLISFICLFLNASIGYSQKIKVTCHDTQTLRKGGYHDSPNTMLTSPDFKSSVTPADCDYVFDLQNKTLEFVSRSNPRSRYYDVRIDHKGNGKYVVVYEDSVFGDTNPERVTVNIHINTVEETFNFLYYNQYVNQTSMYPTGLIAMEVLEKL